MTDNSIPVGGMSIGNRFTAVFTGTPLAPTVPPTPEATETLATGEVSVPPDYVVRPSDSDPPPPSLHIADRDEGGSPAAEPTAAPDQAPETGSAFRWSTDINYMTASRKDRGKSTGDKNLQTLDLNVKKS